VDDRRRLRLEDVTRVRAPGAEDVRQVAEGAVGVLGHGQGGPRRHADQNRLLARHHRVEGRVAEVRRPGKVKGVAQLQLAFDQIRSPDNRTATLHAELVEISPIGGADPQIDPEGGVKGQDSTKDDAAKVGAASGIGAIIGAIAGGGKGAAIGAIIGGGAGTAGVMSQRGKDIRLEHGQHLKIRTSTDTGVL